ncbi:nucleobase:cation symporter-2 family protein [Yinghuangia seranimata]|uniref:nucleobase:cation symporter-2 family protein n=1 Tax=Yinghuangia seranimata TaxID=408067 RepID=UPI00248BA1D6|nr:nucleobase:cation symporter-2 family protein [Yinghuangia seranimata]MDI2125581.1 nucleobase:cation symporter-2 family protein [Yinghuangia seranimata]
MGWTLPAKRTTEDPAAVADAVHPVDELLPPGRLLAGALQHVATMYAGVAAPPLIIGGALGLSAAELSTLLGASLLIAGLATVLQTIGFWKVGSRLPFVNGVTFAVVSPILAVVASKGDATLPVVFGSTIIAGVFCFVLAPVFCRLVRFFPPVVSGTVITLIGVSLLPVAGNWAQGGNSHAPGYGSASNLALAGITLVSILLLHQLLTGFLQRIAILLGLVVGTLAAIPFGKVHGSTLKDLPVFEVPKPFAFGAPEFDAAVIVSMLVVMVVCMTESTADIIALGEVVDKPADDRTIAGGLRADGLATAFAGFFNGFACTAFAQNIGLVALTKIRSRFVVAVCGLFLVLMGLMPVVGGLVALVPQPVLGGAGVVLFGSVATAGIRTLGKADLNEGGNALIVAVSMAFGVFPIAYPHFYDAFPEKVAMIADSGISAGCVAAVVLNLALNHFGRKRVGEDGENVEAEAPVAAPQAAAV